MASTKSALPAFGTFPSSSSILALEQTPTKVPTVSKKSTNKKVNTIVINIFIFPPLNACTKSTFPAISPMPSNLNTPVGKEIPKAAAASLSNKANPHPIIAETNIPQRIAPLILFLSKTAIIISPIIVIITAGVNSPNDTIVDWFATTNPELTIPINAINSPIPPVTANFIFLGIAFTTASLILNNDKIINIIPSTNTAVKATFHEIPICPTTV